MPLATALRTNLPAATSLLATALVTAAGVVPATLMAADQTPAPQRVLFVGASLTSRLPSLAEFSLIQVGRRIQADAVMRGGTGLAKHIELGLLDHMAQHDYDVVVLTAPWAKHTPQARAALSIAVERAENQGASVIIYDFPVTQATYQDRPETIATARTEMLAMAREHQIATLPVDRAFALALEQLPFEALFVEDRVHFTNAGWYLAMCVSHGVLSGRSPVGLPAFTSRDDDVTMQLEPELATQLQTWAWQAVQEADAIAEADGRPGSGSVLSTRERRPRLALRSPGSDWAAYATGATVPVVARVHSTAAPLERVEVLIDETVVDTLTAAPYRSSWTPTADGTYQLRLRAVDTAGRHARTDAVSVVVGELPPEPARTPPSLVRLQWLESSLGDTISVPLVGARHEPAFASWRLMRGDEELAACPDTAMRLEWAPDRAGYHDLHAIALTDDGTAYYSEPVRVLIYDPEQRSAGPFLGQATSLPGLLELERFDHGGDGTGWSGGTRAKGPRRDSGMMLFPLAERGWIMWAKAGNRLIYTVEVSDAGRYRPVLDAANRGREPGAKRLHLTCRETGQRVSFAVSATGSNTDWIGFATETLELPAGRVQLELHCEDGDINIDTIRFDRVR